MITSHPLPPSKITDLITVLAAILTGTPVNNLIFANSAYADAHNPLYYTFSQTRVTWSLT